MTTGLPPPAPSSTPPPRVALPAHELPADSYAIQEMTRETHATGTEYDPEAAFRAGNLAAGLFPAALIAFLILAFVVIAWTVIAAAA